MIDMAQADKTLRTYCRDIHITGYGVFHEITGELLSRHNSQEDAIRAAWNDINDLNPSIVRALRE